MGFWKVLGGVAAGVGVMVALPVAGPIGAVTAIGSAVGAGLGGLAGAAASAIDENEKSDARRSGEQAATAKYEKKVQKLVTALQEAEAKLHDDKSYFQLLIALFAVGMATASADGHVSDEELADLEEFTAGISHSSLPPHVKGMITRMKNNPPNLNTAMKHVSKLENVDLSLFEAVIEVISASDGKVSEEETALLSAFRKATA
jgi:tellurite resistance protein